MMNFNINDLSNGALGWSIFGLFVVSLFAIKPIRQLIDSKVDALKNNKLNAKQKMNDQREVVVLNILESAAKYIVALVAQNPAYSLSERFTLSKNYLLAIADKHGMQFLDTTINGLVESAFQNYKNNVGGDIHTQVHDDLKQTVHLENDDKNNHDQQRPH